MTVPDPVAAPANAGSRLARVLLGLAGWQLVRLPSLPPKAIIVFYPHTSNWDFVLGVLARWGLSVDGGFVAKHTLFKGLFGKWLRWIGGIPIERGMQSGLVGQMVDEFSRRSRFLLVITPEGTRGYVAGWKSGFYRIALAARVPLVLAFIDYPRRRIGVGAILEPSGDPECDWAALAAFYRDKAGKVPANQGPVVPHPPGAEPGRNG